jgi:ketosteroid isomerase-like protein
MEKTPVAPATTVVAVKPDDTASVPLAAKAVPESDGSVKPAVSQTNATQEIQKTITAWAAAWSQQNVKAYLAFYAPDFKTPKGVSRKDWEAERKERLSRPQWIQVGCENLRIVLDGNRATVRFRQSYKASSFKGNSNKTLVLTRSGNAWLILDENVR